mmetsp:Transcript_11528/g.19605  ORF Transcript_11528/g.19605 Transcript_11528/m.19605 type:complete len:705 (+) Transcript_11528:2-2116(+)
MVGGAILKLGRSGSREAAWASYVRACIVFYGPVDFVPQGFESFYEELARADRPVGFHNHRLCRFVRMGRGRSSMRADIKRLVFAASVFLNSFSSKVLDIPVAPPLAPEVIPDIELSPPLIQEVSATTLGTPLLTMPTVEQVQEGPARLLLTSSISPDSSGLVGDSSLYDPNFRTYILTTADPTLHPQYQCGSTGNDAQSAQDVLSAIRARMAALAKRKEECLSSLSPVVQTVARLNAIANALALRSAEHMKEGSDAETSEDEIAVEEKAQKQSQVDSKKEDTLASTIGREGRVRKAAALVERDDFVFDHDSTPRKTRSKGFFDESTVGRVCARGKVASYVERDDFWYEEKSSPRKKPQRGIPNDNESSESSDQERTKPARKKKRSKTDGDSEDESEQDIGEWLKIRTGSHGKTNRRQQRKTNVNENGGDEEAELGKDCLSYLTRRQTRKLFHDASPVQTGTPNSCLDIVLRQDDDRPLKTIRRTTALERADLGDREEVLHPKQRQMGGKVVWHNAGRICRWPVEIIHPDDILPIDLESRKGKQTVLVYRFGPSRSDQLRWLLAMELGDEIDPSTDVLPVWGGTREELRVQTLSEALSVAQGLHHSPSHAISVNYLLDRVIQLQKELSTKEDALQEKFNAVNWRTSAESAQIETSEQLLSHVVALADHLLPHSLRRFRWRLRPKATCLQIESWCAHVETALLEQV